VQSSLKKKNVTLEKALDKEAFLTYVTGFINKATGENF